MSMSYVIRMLADYTHTESKYTKFIKCRDNINIYVFLCSLIVFFYMHICNGRSYECRI